ncbi:ABC transporter ATP-binding protein [Granulicoccus phenolivorans]|uniref:ABC transporter ATP-binding protein n=1 Tax=Granulicoccus phenolivorans TaxID=266854 RepID=UPI00041AB9DF|nr:ABC transporter ATP-binding protein [Granulicoccus phenolivorans]
MALHVSVPLTTDRAAAPAPEQPVVAELAGVSRAFDGRGVLFDIDLQIHRGEFVALLGRSGSGKSTLLRILARLDADFTGTLTGPQLPSVAFQDSRLLPWRRVLANITLGLRGTDSLTHARELLAEVGLADHERAWPKTLSGGEAQRAALARALARKPELLLMDEPFGALDALTRIRMHQLVRRLCDRYRPGVLLVTHDVDEAILLADRVIVLTEGRFSLDQRIDLPHSGRRHLPEFVQLRGRLLSELGVVDDDQ